MKMVKLLQLSGLIVMLAFISACRHKPKDGLTDTYTSGVIAIAADESFRPIVQEEIDVFEGLFPLAGIVPRYVTEVEAINLLLKDSLRLAITSRRLTPEEMGSFNSRKFFPQEIKIATDGLALITNRGNPVWGIFTWYSIIRIPAPYVLLWTLSLRERRFRLG